MSTQTRPLPRSDPGAPALAHPGLQASSGARPRVEGKFLFLGERKLYLRGVTYGTFRPSQDGDYPSQEAVVRDLDRMAQNGVNAIRTSTVRPSWFLYRTQHRSRVV